MAKSKSGSFRGIQGKSGAPPATPRGSAGFPRTPIPRSSTSAWDERAYALQSSRPRSSTVAIHLDPSQKSAAAPPLFENIPTPIPEVCQAGFSCPQEPAFATWRQTQKASSCTRASEPRSALATSFQQLRLPKEALAKFLARPRTTRGKALRTRACQVFHTTTRR